MALLSAMYTRSHDLLLISDTIGQPYGASDIIMATENNNKSLYLSDLQSYCKK